jgi:hypothetical protein
MLLMAKPLLVAGALALDPQTAERFANLALACVHQEYPNKIGHVLTTDADARPPRELTPAFYGCYDWHSSVHGHWLLARLARLLPEAAFAARARAALERSLTPANVAAEVAYLDGAGRASFERPYGLAWLLQLAGELRESADALYPVLRPLEDAAVDRLRVWLPKLSHPVRSGEHSQTAFALGLVLDSGAGGDDLARLVRERALAWYGGDRDCPLAYEPSGEDFLSPCLGEADLMRRVLEPEPFARWLDRFMPRMTLAPVAVTDPGDPKLAHLDGLNLSRAWMLEGIASGLPAGDERGAALLEARGRTPPPASPPSPASTTRGGTGWAASPPTW